VQQVTASVVVPVESLGIDPFEMLARIEMQDCKT
jgi:hypothetical protein